MFADLGRAMRVIVTGGAGFVGSNLCERLAAVGHQVVAIDCFDDYYDPRLKRENARIVAAAGVEVVEADIRDANRIEALFLARRPEVVVHLAARAGVRPSIATPELYSSVNVLGTTVLLEVCRKAGVRRFVFGSSSSVYGELREAPFSEAATLLRPISPYAATKLAGEALAYVHHHLHGLEVACLRFFTVYGPRQRPDLAIRLFTERILSGQEITLYGDGTTSRDYTWVDDIVDGIVAAMTTPISYEIVNLGGSQTTTLINLVRLIEASAGTKARIRWAGDQPGDVPLTYADVSKAGALLGYRPKVAIADGIRRFVAWVEAGRK